jgi:hypothetical protein
MVEAFLLNCLQSNFLIGRIRLSSQLTEPQKVELIREIRMITRKDCFIL